MAPCPAHLADLLGTFPMVVPTLTTTAGHCAGSLPACPPALPGPLLAVLPKSLTHSTAAICKDDSDQGQGSLPVT